MTWFFHQCYLIIRTNDNIMYQNTVFKSVLFDPRIMIIIRISDIICSDIVT